MKSDLFDLSGRVGLVTGAGRGLGRAAALALAGAGATVATAARSRAQIEDTSEHIRENGGQASAHVVDVRSVSEIKRMVGEVVRRYGRIDILVNNAGTKMPQLSLDVTEDAWDDIIDTNLKGAFFCAQAVARVMIDNGSGKIINMASTYSVIGGAGRATYAASKGGLLQLTRVMAIELAPKGINVNAIGPTATRTPMNEPLFAQEEWRREALARIPAGRYCEPEDIAGAVIYLSSRASDMVHGHLLLIDGGLTAA